MLKSSETKMSAPPIVSTLRDKTDQVLADLTPADSKFALLDFPNHGNLGDSAIYVGEAEYLRRRALQPAYVACHDNFSTDHMDKLIGGGPIFIHGGGNFGDLWPWHQEHREEVMARYPGRPVIQFPQTIFYETQESIDRTARIIEKHGAFTLLVRDQRSFEQARKSFQCDVRLCPDMAFQIDCHRQIRPHNELLLHLREDQEAADEYDTKALTQQPSVVRADWPVEHRSFTMGHNVMSLPSILSALAVRGPFAARSVQRAERAYARFMRAVNLLQESRFVITDRMHGHILCTLLNIPHCVIDNSYGKTSGFMEAWGTNAGCARLASDVPEAVEVLTRDFGLRAS